MRRNALRRAIGAALILLLASVAASRGHVVSSTLALFNAETKNAGSSFADGWVGPPSNLRVTSLSGNGVNLAWTVGTPNVDTQTLLGYDGGTTVGGSCNGIFDGAYTTTVGTIADNTTASYADSSRASGINGHYYCYELQENSTAYSTWKGAATLRAQVGMFASAVANANVLTSGRVAKTDTITITWSQRTSITATSTLVCVYTDGTILIGDTGTGSQCRGSGDGYTIAKLKSSGTLGTQVKFGSSSVSSTTSAPFTTKITLAGSNTTSTVSGSPTWTLTPSTSVLSNTGSVAACASGSNCTPTTTSSF